MFDPSRLTPDARVRFPGDEAAVTLVSVRQGPFWDFVFRGPSGGFGEVTLPEGRACRDQGRRLGERARCLTATRAGSVSVLRRGGSRTLSVTTCRGWRCRGYRRCLNQLDAVYGVFLEEPALRFLLADDPGAGKTIMAGLFVKDADAAPRRGSGASS